MAYARPAKKLHEMTDAERADHYAACETEVRKIAIDDLRRPISFKGCGPWHKITMAVVQHDAGPNSITVSHDGNEDGAWRLPLNYTRSSKAGDPITRIVHTAAPFQRMPEELGFLLIEVPGWLASKQELCQARSPTLSTLIEWTPEQIAAWDRVRAAFFNVRDSGERERKRSYRQRRYNAERQARCDAGFVTVSDLASGRVRL